MLSPWNKSYDKPRQCIERQWHHFSEKAMYSQNYDFSSSYVQIQKLDHKEGSVQNDWCFWTVLLEKTLEGPLDRKEIKPVNPKGNQPWILIEGLMLNWSSNIYGLLMQRADSLEKTLVQGKTEGRRRGWQRMRWLDEITDLMDMSLNKLQQTAKIGKSGVRQYVGSQRVRHDWVAKTERLISRAEIYMGKISFSGSNFD